MHTGKDKATLRGHTTCICCLKFDDKIIASGSFKAIKLWDTKTCQPITCALHSSGSVASSGAYTNRRVFAFRLQGTAGT
jgi:WD40 repeat protein